MLEPELARRQYYGAWGWYPGYASNFGYPGAVSAAAIPAVGGAAVASTVASTVPFVASSVPFATSAVAASAVPFLAKRQRGYGGYGGWGWQFPFVSVFNNEFDRASNRANFNENTLYANNINANQANNAVHSNTNNFIAG
ncbi:hypothetical protein FBU59_005191 [Linderina macrospora]|uniref:Uncharacterized protein n=1 Tax=Linderina macrospora TaxID=4868 RepID=A0ACC1J3L0_9FUNG|nr:hypothetical protein FBU59_005191 [Linderina macrospora]